MYKSYFFYTFILCCKCSFFVQNVFFRRRKIVSFSFFFLSSRMGAGSVPPHVVLPHPRLLWACGQRKCCKSGERKVHFSKKNYSFALLEQHIY